MTDEFELEDPIMAFSDLEDEEDEAGLGADDTEDADDLEDEEELTGVTGDEEEEGL